MKRSLVVLFLLAHATVSVIAQTKPSATFDVQMSNAPIAEVIKLYGNLTDRTVLAHPYLPTPSVSLQLSGTNRAEAVRIVTDLLETNGIHVVLDGTKFVLLIPVALKNVIQPHSEDIKPAPASVTKNSDDTGLIDLRQCSTKLMVDFYAAVLNCKVDPASAFPDFPPAITLFSKPLTREEAAYAVKTLLEWHNVRVVRIAPNLIRAEPIAPK